MVVSLMKTKTYKTKLLKGTDCARCGRRLEKGERVKAHMWKTPSMPAYSFEYYHTGCKIRR